MCKISILSCLDIVRLMFCPVNLADKHRGEGNVLRALYVSSSLLCPCLFFFHCNTNFFSISSEGKRKSIWAAEFILLLVILDEKRTQLAFELLYSFEKTNSLLKKNPLLAEQVLISYDLVMVHVS